MPCSMFENAHRNKSKVYFSRNCDILIPINEHQETVVVNAVSLYHLHKTAHEQSICQGQGFHSKLETE